MREKKILDVYFFEHKAGQLSIDDKQIWSFQYDSQWLKTSSALPLSLSLPLQQEAFDAVKSHAFFSNLLPESNVREAIAKHLGISIQNDFMLLSEIGGECAGAVSLLSAQHKLNSSGKYRLLSATQIQKLFETLPGRPFLVGEKNIRLSLAGAQNKLPVYIDDKSKIYLPIGNYASSHILKPPIPLYPATVSNEAFCMKLAKAIGLSVANADIYHEKIKLYCTERFDRYHDEGKKLQRLHQEDFCQALGVTPTYKYESEGGPTLKQCFDILKKYSIQAILDQHQLLQWVIFNYLIGNADGHAKNIALLFTETGPKLAPFYDLFCTAIYKDLTSKLAMKIGGENRPEWIQKRHWEKFAQENEFNFKIIINLAKEIIEKILLCLQNIKYEILEIMPEDKKYLEKIENIIEIRAKKLVRILL